MKKPVFSEGAVQRVSYFLEYKGITKYKFYKETGLSNGFLDKNRNIGSDKCEIISERYPDLNPTWLLTGKGDMLLDAKKEAAPPSDNAPLLRPELQILTEQLHIKDEQIERKDSQIDRRDQQFGHQLEIKDDQIERKDSQIDRKDDQIEKKDSQINRKDQQIEFLHEYMKALLDKIKIV